MLRHDDGPQTVTANFAQGAVLVSVTVPAGRTFTLNGVNYTTSASVLLATGSYSLSTTSPQATGAGSEAVFIAWSDGGAQSHQINVAGVPLSITGTFKGQFLLTASAVPAMEGSVSQSSANSAGPWYDPGAVVLLQASANPGYAFNSWSGVCSGTIAFCFVTMDAPKTVTANFGKASEWVQLSPGSSPPAESAGAMVYDAARKQSVLVDGFPTGGSAPMRTWTFDGTTWTQQHPLVSPSKRVLTGLAYDAGAAQTVLFGGQAASNGSFLNDTWLWNGLNWTLKTPAVNPPGMVTPTLAYDAARGQTVLFGFPGTPGATANQTWVWNGVTWTQKFPAHNPPARQGQAVAYDAANQVVVLFGGTIPAANALMNDTFVWNGVDWLQQAPGAKPSPRSYPAMTYDPIRQRTLLFGGSGATNDTWEWDGGNWTQQTPPLSPPARAQASLTYDVLHQQAVLFGGVAATNFSDTWVWIVPSVKITPVPSAQFNGKRNALVQVQNQSNIPLTKFTLNSATLTGVPATNFLSATSVTNVSPGANASFTIQFPANVGAAGSIAILTADGTYDAGSGTGVPWTGSWLVVLP